METCYSMFVTSVSNKIKCRPIRTRQIGGNPILLNLSTTFCTIMSGEAHHHFQLGPDDLNLHFLWILVLQKTHFLLKLIFRATELYQRTKFDTFEKALFCTLASSANLVLNTVPIAARQYLWRGFTFFY